MKIKVSEASGVVLDWMAAKAEDILHPWGYIRILDGRVMWITPGDQETADAWHQYSPSTDWAQGGPIIEREKIRFDDLPDNGIRAFIRKPIGKSDILLMDCWDEGITPLIAAMRCYVSSKLGEEVDVPDLLI